jgi:hypothetical protein
MGVPVPVPAHEGLGQGGAQVFRGLVLRGQFGRVFQEIEQGAAVAHGHVGHEFQALPGQVQG